MMDVAEEWRVIGNWPRYEVSNLGRVRRAVSSSIERGTRPGRVLSGTRGRGGYNIVTLSEWPHRRRTAPVHQLVAEAFIGPRPTPQHGVAHYDGVPENNHVSNLRWATQRENIQDTIRHGRTRRGVLATGSKLSDSDVLLLRRLYWQENWLQPDLAARFGVSKAHVSLLVNRKSWSWLADGVVSAGRRRPRISAAAHAMGIAAAAAAKRAKTHCKRGHPFSGDNLVQTARQRVCRACGALSRQKSRALKHPVRPDRKTLSGKRV